MLKIENGISDNEWHQLRKNGIGGSECSAILGLNPYMTNVDLWEQKTGKKEPKNMADNSCVIFGKEHELMLIEQFANEYSNEYDVKHKKNDIRFSNKNDFMFASLDAELTDKRNGKKGVLEIKTCQVNQYNYGKWKQYYIPDNYYCQVLHYLSVTDYAFAIVYVMLHYNDGTDDFKEIKLVTDRHLDEIAYLEKMESDFWNNYVLKNKKPLLKVTM